MRGQGPAAPRLRIASGWTGFLGGFGVGLLGTVLGWGPFMSGKNMAATALLVVACFGVGAVMMPSEVPRVLRWAFRVAVGILALAFVGLLGGGPVPPSSIGDVFILGLLLGGVMLWWGVVVVVGVAVLAWKFVQERRRRRASPSPRLAAFTQVRR